MTHFFDFAAVNRDIERLLASMTGLPADVLATYQQTPVLPRPTRDVVGLAGQGTLSLRGRSWGHDGPDVGFRLAGAPFVFEGSLDRNWTILDCWCPEEGREAEARALVAQLTAGLTGADFDALAGAMCTQELAEDTAELVNALRGLSERARLLHRATLREALVTETDRLRRAAAARLLSGDFPGTPADLLTVLDESVGAVPSA